MTIMPNDIPEDLTPPPTGPPIAAPPKKRSALVELVGGQRLRPLWIIAAVGWLIFGAFRAALLMANWGMLKDLGFVDILRCMLVGMRYDAVPIGYALLPAAVVMLLAPEGSFSDRRFRRGATVYAVAVIVLATFVEVVGAGFFLYFGCRLNWLAIAHVDHFRETAGYIWRTYPIGSLFLGTVVVFAFSYYVLTRVLWRGGRPTQPLRLRILTAMMLVGLCILACRGGLDSHPLRRSKAYISANNIINQLTMNNFYTLFHAAKDNIDDTEKDGGLYSFPNIDDSATAAASMLFQEGDVATGGKVNPLWRKVVSERPRCDYNVVIIMMESMSGSSVGALGYSPSQTPVLDGISRQGMFFERMYAVGSRTSRGMVGVLCGHPDLGGVSILKQDKARGNFLSLPSILQRRGYRTLFVYGGDPAFDSMREFFAQAGIDTFITQNDMPADDRAGDYGVPDEISLHKANEAFASMGRDKFFAVILTVSNHEPYVIPAGRVELLPHDTIENKRVNGIRYSDWALGEFFRKARKESYFKRTIFVLVADHGRVDPRRILDVPGHRIPCIIYAPGIIPPRCIRAVASQTDITPTLLGLLGGAYEHCFLGRDILSVRDEGFATLRADDRMAIVLGDTALVLTPEPRRPDVPIPVLFRTDGILMEAIAPQYADPVLIESMQNNMLSIYRMAGHLFVTQAFCRPPGNAAGQGQAALDARAQQR